MKYKGAEITEMTPDQWNGKSREMLCWHVEPKSDDSDAFFKEVIVGYYNNHWHSHLGYRYEHCAEIPETVQQTVSLDECIEKAGTAFGVYATNPNCEAAAVAYSTKMYLEDLKQQKLFSECAEAQQSEIKNLEKSNSKLHCSLLHALSEVFRLKYEQAFDFEIVDTNNGHWVKKRYMHRKDMLFRKSLAYRDAYKEAKKKLKD